MTTPGPDHGSPTAGPPSGDSGGWPQLIEWKTIVRHNREGIARIFHFHDFAQALAFVCKVRALAKREGHPPDIVTRGSAVTVTWWAYSSATRGRLPRHLVTKTDQLYLPE